MRTQRRPALQDGIFELTLTKALERHVAASAAVVCWRRTGITLNGRSTHKSHKTAKHKW